jgi:hypothetical protein
MGTFSAQSLLFQVNRMKIQSASDSWVLSSGTKVSLISSRSVQGSSGIATEVTTAIEDSGVMTSDINRDICIYGVHSYCTKKLFQF